MPETSVPRETDADEAVAQARTERTRARQALLELADAATDRGDHELATIALRVRALR